MKAIGHPGYDNDSRYPDDDRGATPTTADVARDFIAYYTEFERHPSGGCGNCGGLPHSATCFVGRFIVALDEGATDPARVQSEEGSQERGSAPEIARLRGREEH